MNVVSVLMSAVKEGTPDALQDDTQTSGEASSETASGLPTPTIIEHESVETSEDQILSLLDANDGRMWQQDVVAETGFSAATVSRRLSELEADDQVARLRKGRKKIVVDPERLPPVLSKEQ